jgi:hypothetical protein
MQIYGYGEDALTLWAMKYKLGEILAKLDDKSDPDKCTVFYRPSFGRRSGPTRSEFGEPDFILMSETYLYIGESKRIKPDDKKIDKYFKIKDVQKFRNIVFRNYLDKWLSGNYEKWDEFRANNPTIPDPKYKTRRVPETERIQAKNLFSVLKMVKEKYTNGLKLQDIMLFFHLLPEGKQIPEKTDCGWDVIPINYFEAMRGNFVLIGK